MGWAVLLDYLVLPMVIRLMGGTYLSAQFPGIPIGVWIVGFIVITTLLNILGIKVTDKANFVLMAFQLLVLVFFVVRAIGSVVSANSAGGPASGQPFFNDNASFATISAGLVVAQFASGLAAQASASRLLYAMGRDSVLPKAVFGRLRGSSTPRWRTW